MSGTYNVRWEYLRLFGSLCAAALFSLWIIAISLSVESQATQEGLESTNFFLHSRANASYRVRAGDTYGKIASLYPITGSYSRDLALLQRANPKTHARKIALDQILVLPLDNRAKK